MSEPTPNDRLWTPLRLTIEAIVRDLLGYPATYEYTITDSDGATVSGTPNDTTVGLPAINKAPNCASSIGALKPVAGKLCHVKFMSANLRFPRVVWCEPEAGVPAAGVGDTVTIANVHVVAPGGGGPCTISQSAGGTALDGAITSGSSRVSRE